MSEHSFQYTGRSSADRAERSPLQVIRDFLTCAQSPVAIEPGSEPIPLTAGSFVLEERSGAVFLEAWSDQRNIARKVTGIEADERGRLAMTVERFGRKTGTLLLVDEQAPRGAAAERRLNRLTVRERFRRALTRRFPGWRLRELTMEADLQHSLSPSYPRALIQKGAAAWAAIGAEGSPDQALTFGLIWLDYLRARERRLTIEGLVLYLPVGRERTTCLRLRWLDPRAARYVVLAFGTDGHEDEVDVRDYGNLDTRVEPFREQPAGAGEPGPEKWLETRIRSQIRLVDSSLLDRPVYGQVPQFTAGERDVVDLLGAEPGGRLCVLELKASEDVHLPVQALDYWLRVRWHCERGDFTANGYFPGIPLRRDPPRLVLAAPALHYHPSNERVVRYFSPEIELQRVGLGADWRQELKVMFRYRR